MNRFRRFISIVIVAALIFNMPMSNFADNSGLDEGIFLIDESVAENNEKADETETTYTKAFIEETEAGLSIVEYEKKLQELEESEFDVSDEETKIEETKDSFENEETSVGVDLLESAIAEKMSKKLNEIIESSDVSINTSSNALNDENGSIEEEATDMIETIELEDIATTSEIENDELSNNIEENVENETIATISELKETKEVNLLGSSLFGSGNHTSTAHPRVVINSTYDRYEIYTGENAATVRISDDNGTYYNDINNTTGTNVKVIRDMIDPHNNSPILLKLASNVQFFDFDNENDNYVLLPNGYVEELVARESGNGYLNPQGINALDHISVNLTFNSTDLGTYDLFEYGVLYYLSCYEGVLGEYYYYNPSNTNIDRAASFYVNNRIMDRTYNIVSEYFYSSPSGDQLSFKPTWLINPDNLTGANKETYAKQWVNFPYFLIKTGEKYWNLRESIEQSTYLAEYAEGYYEQYMTEAPYGNVAERLAVLDTIYRDEESLLSDTTSSQALHPYVKSDAIEVSGNFRVDTFNEENKMRASGAVPYDTYLVLNATVSDIRAKSMQVYLNGEKLITNNNHGLYTLVDGKCSIRIEGSALLIDANSRNVVSFILLDEEGNYLTDNHGRIVNSYITLIRNSAIAAETYNITYVTNGGTPIPNSSVEEGNRLSLPAAPNKDYCSFMG